MHPARTPMYPAPHLSCSRCSRATTSRARTRTGSGGARLHASACRRGEGICMDVPVNSANTYIYECLNFKNRSSSDGATKPGPRRTQRRLPVLLPIYVQPLPVLLQKPTLLHERLHVEPLRPRPLLFPARTRRETRGVRPLQPDSAVRKPTRWIQWIQRFLVMQSRTSL